MIFILFFIVSVASANCTVYIDENSCIQDSTCFWNNTDNLCEHYTNFQSGSNIDNLLVIIACSIIAFGFGAIIILPSIFYLLGSCNCGPYGTLCRCSCGNPCRSFHGISLSTDPHMRIPISERP